MKDQGSGSDSPSSLGHIWRNCPNSGLCDDDKHIDKHEKFIQGWIAVKLGRLFIIDLTSMQN